MGPSFSEIEYFIEVAKMGNISRASERLGITQPSLSQAIRRLESSVGSDLLIRGRLGVKLTKSGSEFFHMAERFLSHWQHIKSSVNEKESEVSGDYTIGCHQSVALYSLPLFLPQLVKQYSNLNIELVHDLSRKILQQVVSFQIDYSIVVNPIKHPELVIQLLCTDQVMLWVNPTLVTEPLESLSLICDPNLTQVQKIISDLKKMGFPCQRIIKSSNLEVVCSLTAQGAGIGILPNRVATRQYHDRIKSLGDHYPIFDDRVCLVYRADIPKTKAHHAITSGIKESF